MKNNFNKTILCAVGGPSCFEKTVRLEACGDGMDISLSSSHGDYFAGSFSKKSAIEIRDALLEAYPLNSTFNEDAPKVGDIVVPKPGEDAVYFHNKNYPFKVVGVEAPGDLGIICDLEDKNGKRIVSGFSWRLKSASVQPVRDEAAITAAEVAGYARGIATVQLQAFDSGHQIGYYEGKASAKPKSGKWETVADGMDRLKIDGGYLYQNDSDELVFVPDAMTGKTLCSFGGKCASQVKA